MAVDQRVLDTIALSRDEYDLIVSRLGREPSEVELGMFGALWSEHCGYKNSRPLLRQLPGEGAFVLTKRGEENAGAVDIGDGMCVVMKIESHNHPSAIEPYEGAATGVGGIVRDIFAMGARPIAILDSLRFGPLSDPHNRYLFGGVVGGIGGYGNCLGIPTVGGEAVFEEAYSANPLINAMCVGVAPIEKLVSGRAEGEGNLLMLVGADTGRDGIHGASGLASRTDPQARFDELRPAVQVGNPFLEKMLMEACLDLAGNHADWITGIEDLGAAGLTSACLEAATRGGSGIRIDVARVPRREEGMTPYEVMLSESQERMLVIVRKGHKDDVAALFERWEVPWAIIGEVTADGSARIYDGDRLVADVPVETVVEAPEYTREPVRPPELDEMQSLDLSALPDIHPTGPAGDLAPEAHPPSAEKVAPTEEGSVAATFRSPRTGELVANNVLLHLLSSPNITSKRWVYRQYDQSVLTNTVIEAGTDAAVVRVKPTQPGGPDVGFAVTTDGNGRYCHVSPGAGGAIAVAEAARNVVCVGAQPVAVTDCLNFGNPERPEVYYQMQEVIRGMAAACQVLSTPVISGNVSLYNETGEQAVYPTPVIGMLGLMDDVAKHCRPGLTDEGDDVFLLGAALEQPAAALAASEYLKLEHGLIGGRLEIDLDLEARVQRAALAAIRQGIATACHDCSDGGLAVALAEMCLHGGLGLDASAAPAVPRLDAALFGEAQSRILVAVRQDRRNELLAIAQGMKVPAAYVGRAGGDRLRLWSLDLSLAELRDAYEGGLERALGG